MAWNKSSEGGGARTPAAPRRTRSVRPAVVRGMIAACVVVVGASIAAWWLMMNKPAPVREDADGTASRRIREVTPSAVPTNAVPVVKEKKKYSDLTDNEKLQFLREKFGDNPPPNIKPIIYTLEHPPKRNFKAPTSKYAIFRHPCERKIAAFLSVRPGSFVMRPQTFDDRFDQDFVTAMLDKIEFTDDDTPEQRELKQAVIDSKKELAALVKQGQKPSEVMTEVSKQLYDLGQYQHNLRKEIIRANQNPDMSDRDVADMVTAANKMLSDKGLQPLRMPNMLARQLNLSRRRGKQETSPAKGK